VLFVADGATIPLADLICGGADVFPGNAPLHPVLYVAYPVRAQRRHEGIGNSSSIRPNPWLFSCHPCLGFAIRAIKTTTNECFVKAKN